MKKTFVSGQSSLRPGDALPPKTAPALPTPKPWKRHRHFRERRHGIPLSQTYHGHSAEAVAAAQARAKAIQGERD